MDVQDTYEEDKRLSWRSKRVLTTGVGLALFATMLAVAVHTSQRYNRQAAASGRMAATPALTSLAGLDAAPAAGYVAGAFSQPAATAKAHEAPGTGGDRAQEAKAPTAAPAADAPVEIEAGDLRLATSPGGVVRLAMAGTGGMDYLGGGGFGFSHAGLGGGGAIDTGAGPVSASGAGSGGGAGAGARNLSGAGGGGAGAGDDEASEASPDGDGTDGDGHGDNAAPGNDGNGDNDSNADGNGDNDSNADGNGDNDSIADGNSGNPGDDHDPLAFAGSALATLPGALTSLGAGDGGESDFGSAAGETAQVEVPEPATLGMLAIGLAGLGLSRRRRRSD